MEVWLRVLLALTTHTMATQYKRVSITLPAELLRAVTAGGPESMHFTRRARSNTSVPHVRSTRCRAAKALPQGIRRLRESECAAALGAQSDVLPAHRDRCELATTRCGTKLS